ncbi:MAG: S24 family peptidase [Henriciella sp.]|nr:S24 family peptidase [Henriciella sp.]
MSQEDDKLRYSIDEIGVAKISKQSGVPKTTIYSFMRDKNRSLVASNRDKIVEAIEELTGAPIGTGEDVVSLPFYDIRASAGAGALIQQSPPEYWVPYRLEEVSRFNVPELTAIRVGGDSMWDTLHDGDQIVIDRGVTRIVTPGIYVLLYEGHLIVKRCQRNLGTGTVLVTSDNTDYESFTVDEPDTLTVVGRVVMIHRILG